MKSSINCMKNLIARILIVSLILACSVMPIFAAAENTEYENSLKAGWGSTYLNWTAPSGYGYSWNAQVLRFFVEFNTRIKNIYDTLGTTNSVLGDIKTRTGYIPTINDNILKLYSGWGTFPNWSQPSSMGTSWYAWVQKALFQYKSDLTDIVTNTSYLSNYDGYLSQITTNSAITSNNTTNINSLLNSALLHNLSSINPYYISGFSASSSATSEQSSTWFTDRNKAFAKSFGINNLPFINFRQNSSNYQSSYSIDTATPNSLYDYLYFIDSNSVQTATMLFSPRSLYYNIKPNYTNGSTQYRSLSRIYSISDFLSSINDNSAEFFARMGYVLADDDTIASKNANKPQEQSILGNFTGSGDASASVSDIGTAKDTITGIKSGLTTGTSASNVIGVFNSDEGYNWFSDTVSQDIDHTNSSSLRSTRSSSTPLLDEKMNALYSVMGVIND